MAWWQSGIVYQIYPRSFQDSNGDGVGDLQGILQRLDYLHWLGVDAIWISPIYPSPMADFGYDVSDYRDIHPLFGSMSDLEQLLEAVHARGMKLILDFVPNHTSDQHPWFIESRADRDNPRRDWYFWRDPAPDGGPPNNWISRFDGRSAWEWDDATQQYYLHIFLKEQPDLDWRNPAVRQAMLDHLRFWFDKGIDGFRIDVAYRVMKEPNLADNPANPHWVPGTDPSMRLIEKNTKNTPDNHLFNRWLREVSDEYQDRVLIGEMNLPVEEIAKHYGDGDELHLPFNFRLIFSPWERDVVADLIERYEAALPAGAWPNWVLSNHDQPRFATRAGAAQARAGMMALLTLRGTPTVYYGEEIGLENVPIPPDKVQDPWEINVPGLGLGRDPERTPMQWTAASHAGFTAPDVTPWLPVGDDFATRNVVAQAQNERSFLSFTRQLIALRRAHPALHSGNITLLDLDQLPADVLAYRRTEGSEEVLVLLNFGAEAHTWAHAAASQAAELLISTEMDRPHWTHGQFHLRPNEGQVWLLGR